MLDLLQKWQTGIQKLDVEKVKAALEAGLSPSSPIKGQHPLHYLFKHSETAHEEESFFYVLGRETSSDDNQKKAEIVDLLLAHGLSVLEPVEDSKPLVDTILFGNDSILVSKVVYAAIKESAKDKGAVYQFDLEALMERTKDDLQKKQKDNHEGSLDDDDSEEDENDFFDARATQSAREGFEKKQGKLEEIHGYIRMILENSADEDDKSFQKKHSKRLKFWNNEFKKIPVETLDKAFPVDVEALKDARKNMGGFLFPSLFGRRLGLNEKEDDGVITLTKEDPEAIMHELEQYTGIETFKEHVESLVLRVLFDKARMAHGLPVDDQNFHTAFVGNSGTGKTTCARVKARLLHSLDMCGPRYCETSRDGLIGKYIGHSEDRIKELINNVDTLFIDEAYSLVDGSSDRRDYGYRVIDVLTSKMGNKKDKFNLFVAGYKSPMKAFIDANEGLSSRITSTVEMRDFTMPELGKILDNSVGLQGYDMSRDVRDYFCSGLSTEQEMKREKFGNARVIVQVVKDIPNQMAYRLGAALKGRFDQVSKEGLSTVTFEDVRRAFANRGVTVEQRKSSPAIVMMPQSQALN